MFLNYILDEELRPYDGVDVSVIFDIDYSYINAIIELWVRNLMGLCLFLFKFTQTFVWREDVFFGYHLYTFNTMGWDKLVSNIP